jgi:putative tricarboxylic transport membrane protein
MLFGMFGARYFPLVLKLPKSVLATFIAVFSILGSYAINNSMFDVGVMFGATVLALWLRALRVPILPIVLAVILGPLLEQQALVLFTTSAGVGEVLGRPIADGFFAISAIIVIVSVARRLKESRAKPA